MLKQTFEFIKGEAEGNYDTVKAQVESTATQMDDDVQKTRNTRETAEASLQKTISGRHDFYLQREIPSQRIQNETAFGNCWMQ